MKLPQLTRKAVAGIALGQFLSLLIGGTGITSQLLASNYGVQIPTTQSLLNYILLSFYLPIYLWRVGKYAVLDAFKNRWLSYVLLALVDVEANYMVVKAYQYTNITSVMLLDCFSIPCVMVLSRLLLKARYSIRQIVGVAVCILGLGLLVLSDYLGKDTADNGNNPLLGDFLCLFGALLYSISNVGQEYYVKQHSRLEWLMCMGIFGSVISALQLAIIERGELETLVWSAQVVLLIVLFSICLFSMYSLTPYLMVLASATMLNLSLLTSDGYAILASIFLFDHIPSPLFYVALVIIVSGLFLYNSYSASSPSPSEESPPYTQLPEEISSSSKEQPSSLLPTSSSSAISSSSSAFSSSSSHFTSSSLPTSKLQQDELT